jgi:hypothetical protein
MIFNTVDIADRNKTNHFLLYESINNNNKNILFIGSCRMSPLMYYWHELYPDWNIYNIYIPYWSDRSTLDHKRIHSILKDTDLIVTETVKNYDILNTDRRIPNNFFEVFDTQAQEIRITNLQLSMFAHDLHNTYNIKTLDGKIEEFNQSKNRLKDSLIGKNQKFIWEFIEDHLFNTRLFATHNHPTKILSLASFIHIIKQLGDSIDISYLSKVIDPIFLEDHYTPILELDIDMYNFTFKFPVFTNNFLEDASYKYKPSKLETNISLELVEKLLSYTYIHHN